MTQRPAPSNRRPNILYVHSHDTGRYIRPYGYALETPNFHRLADEGMLFRHAHTSAPTCSPSRAGVLTGQSPHSAGMLGLAHRGFSLNDPAQHLATTLRDNGYHTALAGIQHVTAGDPEELGYREVCATTSRSCEEIATAAVSLIRSHAAEKPDVPLFLDAGFVETHRPFPSGSPEDARHLFPPAPLPDTADVRQDMADYHASVRRLDQGLGAILDALDETGLAANTIVVATTDHGIAFPRMKCNLTDHGTGVLLILRYPGTVPAGAVTDALVSQIDLFPTLCDLARIPHPAWLQGVSLMPVIDDPGAEVNSHVFSEVTYHAAYEPQRSVRTDRWTYIRRFDDRPTPVLPNCDDGASRDLLLGHGWDRWEHEQEQLYDRVFDPTQARNIATDPNAREIVDELRTRLQAWMEVTDDPLLEGTVPLPPGATMNDPSSRSFTEDLILAEADGSYRTIPNPGRLR
jgi:N-sulfoglucosamine sulfohydrolase